MEQEIKVLAKRAMEAKTMDEALKFSQAALNLAQTAAVLSNTKANEERNK